MPYRGVILLDHLPQYVLQKVSNKTQQNENGWLSAVRHVSKSIRQIRCVWSLIVCFGPEQKTQHFYIYLYTSDERINILTSSSNRGFSSSSYM
jgi:hypothetical protein